MIAGDISNLTLGEVQERLERSQCKLHLNFEHGVYHAYVHGPSSVIAYDRGDLAGAVAGAMKQLGALETNSERIRWYAETQRGKRDPSSPSE